MEKFDLCIIGGGPSGYAAAMRAIDFKKKVLFIEKNRPGGAGIHNGALSSKTFWEISRDFLNVKKSGFKYGFEPVVNYQDVLQEVNDAVQERRVMLEHHLELLKNNGDQNLIKYIKGSGRLIDNNHVEVLTDTGISTYYAQNIILATGSRPRKLPNILIDEQVILTSDGIDSLTDFPKSMVILGAGVVGCEFATIFSNFGKTKVFLIDKGDRILPFEDEDMVAIIEKNLMANGVIIHRNSKLIRMEVVEGQVEYELEYNNGHKETLRVEKALVSVGREPNIENLWNENINIELDEKGYILDDDTQTSVSNIYAVGDITADIALVNVGELEGRHAVEKMFGLPVRPLIYDNISTIMFFQPEAAGVGLNEQQAKELNLSFKVVSLDYTCISRAIAMRNTQGFFKILVTDDDEMKILGMRALGEHASSAIQAVALLISMDKGIEEIAELIHPHPSIIEGIQECVRMLLGKSIFKPAVFQEHLRIKSYNKGTYQEILV